MTVMSKPLRRYEFILGKYLGIIFSITFLGALLTAVFITVIVAKVAACGDIVGGYTSQYNGVWPEVSKVFSGLIF